jgi:DNA-binding NarL/FixJ family response regulator
MDTAEVAVTDEPTPTTMLIVDDSRAFRVQARSMLEAEGFEIVAEAADAAGALAAWRTARPRVVLLDVNLPDGDGFALVDALDADGARPLVVLTSSREASAYRLRLQRTRAAGFIPKDELSGPAIRAVMARRP